jgi:hypothetical protein
MTRFTQAIAALAGLTDPQPPSPLSTRLEAAAFQLAGMGEAGEFDALSEDARGALGALVLAMQGWARECTREAR